MTKRHRQAAQMARALMDRHDIPKHRQASLVGEFFGISRAASHRRTYGTAAWTLEELQAIAAKFGESLPELFAGGRSPAGIAATLKVGDRQSPCRIWLQPDGAEPTSDVFVAIENAGAYTVVPTAAAGKVRTRRLLRLEVDQSLVPPRRVALVGRRPQSNQGNVHSTEKMGYQTSPYDAIEALATDIERAPFDAYILEWKMRGGATVLPLIARIHELTPHAAIALLSSRLRDATTDTQTLAKASSVYNLRLFEKPAQIDFIVAALQRDGLAPARSGSSP